MKLENLRFEFRVVDTETDETVISDSTSIFSIDEFGGSESVDVHVGAALRNVRRDLANAALAPAAAEEAA